MKQCVLSKRVVLLGLLFSVAACVEILGGERSVIGEDRECSDDSECDDDEGCDDSGFLDTDVCRRKCFDDAECGAFRSCQSRFCSDPVGTPCAEYGDCNGGSCEFIDADNDDVLGYCTISCYSSDEGALCPTGFICIKSSCLKL